MVKSRRSSRSTSMSMSMSSLSPANLVPRNVTSERIWKFSLLLLVISILLLIYVVTMPGSIYVNIDTDAGKAANLLSFIGIYLGILVWIYRLFNKLPVLKYWIAGFILAVVIPPIIFYIAIPNIVQPPPAQQMMNLLKYR